MTVDELINNNNNNNNTLMVEPSHMLHISCPAVSSVEVDLSTTLYIYMYVERGTCEHIRIIELAMMQFHPSLNFLLRTTLSSFHKINRWVRTLSIKSHKCLS